MVYRVDTGKLEKKTLWYELQGRDCALYNNISESQSHQAKVYR